MRLRHSRKGQTGEEDGGGMSLVLAGAITVIILLIAIFMFADVLTSTEGEFDDQLCRTSIKTHSKLFYASAGEFATQIECEPRDFAINTDDDVRFHETAEAMRFCYDRWNPDDMLTNGELELFSEEGIYCNPCGYIDFTGEQGLDGFDDYLATTTVPGTDTLYVDYFMPGSSELAVENTPGDFATETPSLAAYTQGTQGTVLFLYARGESIHTIKDNFDRNPNRNVKEIRNSVLLGAGVGAAAVVGTFVVVGTGGLGLVAFGSAGFLATGTGGVTGGLLEYYFGDSERPEWVAMVVMRPNEDDAFANLGCEHVEQKSAAPGPKDV